MKFSLACLLTVIAVGITRAELECTCPAAVHPQADFCNKFTDWVIRARVLSVKEEREAEEDAAGTKYHKMKYRVKISSVYKGNMYLNAGDKVSIFLPPNRCGFELAKNRWYLISGVGTKSHNLRTNVCHWIERMSDLTFHQRLSLSLNRYKQSCIPCHMEKPGCAFEDGVNEDCYDKYATCFQQAGSPNKCTWRLGAGFAPCKSA